MSEVSNKFDPGCIDLVTVDESNNVFKLIVAASDVTSMEATDADALRQKLSNYVSMGGSGQLQERYPSLVGMGCVIQVDVASNAPQALLRIASEFETKASSNGLTLTICEIE
ncbi:DUF6572 domain-containing protein [Microvirga pudoricolor]|uniref:DUF6572 domain-containing protein n=1 Tax=Microvirga pudoricolor TaxID=2778729 RepID=UPI0019506B9B|nr:DUF6572 domain-containing protein [Microvirga pudoricolor]MBM6595494.1 hypothetical protein [Microvirga pudoricolor]